MNVIINNSSMQPIYEQIVGQIKAKIMQGELKEEEMLPSVRSLAKDLRVSALTVKKAYDTHGAGRFCNNSPRKRKFRCLCESGTDAGRKEERSRRRFGNGHPERQKLWNE